MRQSSNYNYRKFYDEKQFARKTSPTHSGDPSGTRQLRDLFDTRAQLILHFLHTLELIKTHASKLLPRKFITQSRIYISHVTPIQNKIDQCPFIYIPRRGLCKVCVIRAGSKSLTQLSLATSEQLQHMANTQLELSQKYERQKQQFFFFHELGLMLINDRMSLTDRKRNTCITVLARAVCVSKHLSRNWK